MPRKVLSAEDIKTNKTTSVFKGLTLSWGAERKRRKHVEKHLNKYLILKNCGVYEKEQIQGGEGTGTQRKKGSVFREEKYLEKLKKDCVLTEGQGKERHFRQREHQ